MVPIPQSISASIDKMVGSEHRTRFIVELLEHEIQRREQLQAVLEAAGSWKDEEHPELANGSDAFVRNLRDSASKRLEKLQQEASQ